MPDDAIDQLACTVIDRYVRDASWPECNDLGNNCNKECRRSR